MDSETVAAALADVEGAPGGGSGVTDDDDHRHHSRPAMAGTGSAAAAAGAAGAAAGGGSVGSVSDAMVRRSLAGLRELCQTQELGYDFQFYPMKFKTDHPVLLCSQRRSSSSSSGGGGSSQQQQQQQQSIVDPNACALPIVFNPAAASAASTVDASDLAETRHYLATVAACPPAPFAPGLDKIAEEDFVRLRQSGQPSSSAAAAAGEEEEGGGSEGKEDVSAADFHRWLTLARLVCASCGETTVQVAHWQRALALEAARVARLPPRLQPAAASAATNTPAFAGMTGSETFASPAAVRTHPTNAMGPPPPPLGAPKQVFGGVANCSPSSSSVGARWALPVHMEGEEE